MNDPAPDLCLVSRIPRDAAGLTVLAYLTARFRYRTQDQWRAELFAGRIRVDGRPVAGYHTLRAGAELAYLTLHREPYANEAVVLLHHAGGFVVADKPAHLPMHADGPFVRRTFVQIVRELARDPALQLVHRLDRETSGLCVAASDQTARSHLQRQFAASTVAKTYLAIVRGELHGSFVIEAPIGRSATSRIALRRSAAADARDAQPARTAFEVLAVAAGRSLVRCRPTSGRTHQIRVHLEAHGAPLLGDKLYGHPDDHYLAFVERVKRDGDARLVAPGEPDRHLLHASDLAFVAPAGEQPIAFHCDPPADFAAWLPDSDLPTPGVIR